jgi:hypothetical protein
MSLGSYARGGAGSAAAAAAPGESSNVQPSHIHWLGFQVVSIYSMQAKAAFLLSAGVLLLR